MKLMFCKSAELGGTAVVYLDNEMLAAGYVAIWLQLNSPYVLSGKTAIQWFLTLQGAGRRQSC